MATNTQHLTREQAEQIVGAAAVSDLDGVNCEPTNRAGHNGACQGDATCEWSASVLTVDADGAECRLTAYYYTDNDQDAQMDAAGGDGAAIDWVVDHYSVI